MPGTLASAEGCPTARFGEVVRASVYGTTGYLAESADLDVLEAVIVRNLPVLREFPQVLVATNYAASARQELSHANDRLWRSYLPAVGLVDSRRNRGHSIGTSDLDNLLFDACKASGARWLCKGANDVLLDAALLDIEVRPGQFHYLNAVSFGALEQHDFDLARFTGDFFYPQTTFYAIDVGATDFLIDKSFLDASWNLVARIPDYNGRIWEYVPGWSCESLLRRCVLRNGLTRSPLMSDRQWSEVVRIVIEKRIEDCSLKGLSINGICHAQGATAPVDVLTVSP